MKTRRLSRSWLLADELVEARAGGSTPRPHPRRARSAARSRAASLIAPSSCSPARISASSARLGAEPLRRRGDRAVGVAARIAEIDQRRDRVGGGAARARPRRAPRGGPSAMPPTLSFSSLTMRWASFGPTPSARVSAALSCATIAVASASGASAPRIASASLRADALHRRQQAEPVALGLVGEAVEMDVVLAHMGLDQEPQRLAARRQPRQRARRAEDEIADAVDVEHDAVGAGLIDDRRRASRSSRAPAAAPGALGRGVMGVADGDGQRVGGVGRCRAARRAAGGAPSSATCALSAWPAPTTDFLIELAEYSNTGMPRSAGASSTTPRATPSFRVEAGFLLTKVSSTAASSGAKRSSTSLSCAEERDQPLGERPVRRDDARRRRRHGSAGCRRRR